MRRLLRQNGRLHIRLPQGLILGGFELACGDTFYDPSVPPEEQKNKDGHYGSLGNAKIFVRLSSETESFIVNANVPPAGVISGGPIRSGYCTKAGDVLIVESRHHPSWIMGYRVVFMQPGAP